jgi:hypothetical protein
MSELKAPVLGCGILQLPILQSSRHTSSPTEYYRADIGSEENLVRLLSRNWHRVLDPYPGTDIEAVH